MFTLLSRGLDCALHISHKVTTSFFFTAVQRIYAIFICNMHNVCTNFLGSTDMWLEFLNQVSQILWLLREAMITQTSVTKLKLKFPYFPPSPVLKAIDLLWICVESLVNSCPYHQRQKTETCVGDSLYTAALWNWISLWAWACSSRMWRVCQSYLTFGKQTCTSPVHRLLVSGPLIMSDMWVGCKSLPVFHSKHRRCQIIFYFLGGRRIFLRGLIKHRKTCLLGYDMKP